MSTACEDGQCDRCAGMGIDAMCAELVRLRAGPTIASVLAYVRSYEAVREDGTTVYGPYQDAADMIADGIEDRFKLLVRVSDGTEIRLKGNCK